MLINRIHRKTLRPFTAGLLLVGALLVACAVPASAQRFTPERELLNRLVQTGGNEPAARAFVSGRDQINEGKWVSAATTFSQFISQYPSDKNVDAALYWLAYAYDKQKMHKEADKTIKRLIKEHPKSVWKDDAEKLGLMVSAKLGNLPDPQQQRVDADCELKVIALQSLCQNDRPRCSSFVNDTLRANSTCTVLKEAAITYLGRYGGTDAVPALIQMARSEPNEKLRMRAIAALGNTGDERGLEVLREIALSAAYEDESPTDSALHALARHENPRAGSILADAIINGRNPKARTHGIGLLSQRRGDDVVDLLFRIYDGSSDVEIKKHVLAGLGNRKDPRAVAKLVAVARSAPNPELRKQAIYAIPNRNDEQDLDVLIPLFDSERDEELKNFILDAISRYQQPRAYQKLMQVVRDSSQPVERRKRAISMLSRSKDPEVIEFLKDMLK